MPKKNERDDTTVTITTPGHAPVETTLETLEGLTVIPGAIRRAILQACDELVSEKLGEFLQKVEADEERKGAFGLKVSVDRSEASPTVKVALSWTEAHTGERVVTIDDPKQLTFELAGANSK